MPNRLISRANGNYSDTAPWAVCDTSGAVDSENTTTAISTSELSTPNFTPGVITVDGVALKFSARAASPSGTFTVTLRNTTLGADIDSCTINISDLPATCNGWHFFKFASSQLLVTATTYCIKVVCSASGSQVTLYRSATSNDWSKLLTTDSTASPAAGDQLLVMGEYTGAGTSNTFTITMDSEDATTIIGLTSYTDSIAVNNKGVLSVDTGSSLAYAIKYTGRFSVWSGGVCNFGTSGARVDAASTMTLIMSVAANVDTGLIVQNGGTFNAYGQTQSNYLTYLNTDEAASATVLGVVSTAGWANGDEIAIASTTRTSTQHEKRTISTVDSSTQVTVTAGLTNAHSGTSPTQAEVIHLTRNVKLRGTSASLQGYVWFDDTSTVVCDSVEFSWLGSATSNKRGVDVQTTTGSCTITGCSFHEFSVSGSQFITVSGATSNNISIVDSVFWNSLAGNAAVYFSSATSGTTLSVSGCCIIGAGAHGIDTTDVGVSVTNTTCTSCVSNGFSINEQNMSSTGTYSGLVAHSNGTSGFSISGLALANLSSLTAYRNNANGIVLNLACNSCIFDGVTLFGNNSPQLSLANGQHNVFRNMTTSGDTSFAGTVGVTCQSNGGVNYIENSTFGVVTGIRTAHTTADVQLQGNSEIYLRDCLFASSTEVSTSYASPSERCGVYSQKHDQTAGLHKRYKPFGSATTETTTFNTASPSEKLSPLSATVKFRSSVMRVAVASGATVTISVYVRKNSSYNGAQPRLRLLANPAIGIDSDTTIDTMTAGADSWEQLTGVTAAANDDGVMEFVLDGDGTSGSFFADDWSAS